MPAHRLETGTAVASANPDGIKEPFGEAKGYAPFGRLQAAPGIQGVVDFELLAQPGRALSSKRPTEVERLP